MLSRTTSVSIRGGSCICGSSEEYGKFRRLDGLTGFHVRRSVLDEAFRQRRAPVGAGAALLFVPGHGFPVRRHHKETAGINLDAVAAGLVSVEIEALRIIVLGGAGFEEDAV